MRFLPAVFLSFFLFIVYKMVVDIGLLTFYHNLPNEYTCENLSVDDKNPEHISYYNSTTLIVSKNNFIQLFYKVGAETESGYIQIIADADAQNPEIYPAEIIGFPKGIRFHPFGHYYNPQTKTLAVVNPAYTYGGERIELFGVSEKASRIVLTYKRSILLPENEFVGRLNSIVMPSNDLIYFTVWNSETDNIQGKPFNPKYSKPWMVTKGLLKLRTTKVYKMDLKADGSYDLSILPDSDYMMSNGITTDSFGRIYVADCFAKSVSIYNKELTEIERELQFDFLVDNLVFDAKENKIYVAGFKIAMNYLTLGLGIEKEGKIPDDAWSWTAVWEIDASKPTEEITLSSSKRLLSEKGNMRGPSVAAKVGKYLYLGSWGDLGPKRCMKI